MDKFTVTFIYLFSYLFRNNNSNLGWLCHMSQIYWTLLLQARFVTVASLRYTAALQKSQRKVHQTNYTCWWTFLFYFSNNKLRTIFCCCVGENKIELNQPCGVYWIKQVARNINFFFFSSFRTHQKSEPHNSGDIPLALSVQIFFFK